MMMTDSVITTMDLHDPAQAAAIDTFVLAHAAGTPFHRPAWMLGVEKSTGNRAHMLAAVAPSGRIAGLLPLHHVKSRLFGQALVSAAFAVDGGVLAEDPATVTALADAARQLSRTKGGLSVELHGGPAPGGDWQGYSEHVGFVGPLAADDDAQLAKVARKHRAEVRKGLANPDLRVEIGRGAKLIRDQYRVYAESVRNLGTPVFPAKLLREVFERFGDDADIVVVYQGDRPVSAVLTLYHRGVAMPYWGGGIHEARRLRSNELLYFRLMSHARARGCTHIDFGRSKKDSGNVAWKKSLGFEPTPLLYHTWSPDGRMRDINPKSDKYQRRIDLWKKLPLPIANLLGPLISRGLG